MLVEMDNRKLIAGGWPVALLLEFQWEELLLLATDASLVLIPSMEARHQRPVPIVVG